ncbi:hypothetical protein TraAM80_01919 [Trypanosoma rangeli]|uniref:Uncharacterized protein n=1 Tax=Trypanosoma rangeli TaxID=5698 RepID=A0A422NWH7_TRYRA|nr:uncharacterized protein TraAM80_01919 [Trypanosoma rangeli]RNF09785.1 hypothetical protein TraAM80_01919 [Trypanosoma rangeli]|eukprot:RNF09785.1 hypothetical protein TraAM80_01919 [Trypanosoma rangeli]
MIRDRKQSCRRATLADIVAGRQCLHVPQVSTTGRRSQRASLSSTSLAMPPIYANTEGPPKNNIVGNGTYYSSSLEVGNSDQGTTGNTRGGKMRCMPVNGNGVRRGNIIQPLKKMVIHSTHDDAALKPLFEANANADSSSLHDQWEALVGQLLQTQKEAGDSATQFPEKFLPKSSNDGMKKGDGKVKRVKGTVSSLEHSEASTEQNSENQFHVKTNDCRLNLTRAHLETEFKERWITGSEAADNALLKLFIYCGALYREGRGLELSADDFRHMCVIRQKILPPKRILWYAISKISYWCSQNQCSNSHVMDGLFITPPQFLKLLQDELRGIKGVSRGHVNASDTTLPAVCMVLAALAPKILQELCGGKVVDYLRHPSTVQKTLTLLVVSGEVLSNSSGSCAEQDKTNGISGPFSPRAPNDAKRSQVCSVSFSTGTPLSCNGSCVVAEGASSGNEDLVDERKLVAVSQLEAARVTHGRRETPRYMRQRPLDEISVSVIARSKARRLIDELRRKAIPINRYECFARIEYVQKSIFNDAGLSDEDENDDAGSSDQAFEAVTRQLHNAIRYKTKPPDVGGPLLPGMYKMGGSGQPKPRRARQETFERLHQQRFGKFSGFGIFLRRRFARAPDINVSEACSPGEEDAHVSNQTIPIKVGTSPTVGSHDDRLTHQTDTPASSYETDVRGKMSRRKLRSQVMLADVFTTPFARYAMMPQRPFPSCVAGFTVK